MSAILGPDSEELKGLHSETAQLTEALAETLLESRLLKKNTCGAGRLLTFYPGLETQRWYGRDALELVLIASGLASVNVNHPMTQAMIERWHRFMKNQLLLENCYLPGELKARPGEFVSYYNTDCYHESLNNLTQGDVYTKRGETVLNRKSKTKQRRTIEQRCRLHYQQKAHDNKTDEPKVSLESGQLKSGIP